ncbi:hypothetical protein Cgig2_026981 [Carnegiea gigantea]|uniref:Uncharacterized protein n=1 Tax=Carnegiea gigantea TaxID=171969 RepID=A0A9Q1GHM4_9CARY|nr:hypothetical protein Cgig2_026981 [Carnegiea gigantea]
MDNWLNLKQLNTNVLDYYAQFEEMKLKCATREEQWVTETRFINKLKGDFKGEVGFPSRGVEALHVSPFRNLFTLKGNHRLVSLLKTMPNSQPVSSANSNSFTLGISQPVSSAKGSSLTSPPLLPSLSCLPWCFINDEPIDESVYPIVGDIVTESEHEEDERESSYYHEIRKLAATCGESLADPSISQKPLKVAKPWKMLPFLSLKLSLKLSRKDDNLQSAMSAEVIARITERLPYIKAWKAKEGGSLVSHASQETGN